MKNTGQGETSTVEQSKVDEPVSVVSRNDENKLKNMKAGDKLEIRVADTLVYNEPQDDYFPPMFESGSMINKRMLDKGEIVTYKGVSKESNNIVTNTTIIYLSVTLSDGTDAYVRLASVKLTTTKTSENSEKVVNNDVKIATTVTSRAGEEKKNIGQYGEQYVVGIAAGRNNDTDVGNVNDDKGLIEEELTIKVAEEVEKLLQDYSNIKVVQTGSTSSNPSNVKPENRAEKNRNLNPNLCIQIYFNNGEQAGVQTIYKEGDAISQQLAEILSNNLSSVMGLTNLNAGTDTEKCKNSQGESASLNIIENAAVTGFPSVVAMGGNLNKEPDASVIASDGVSKYAQAIVKSIDEYFKADHSGRTATEQEETKYKDSVESRIINMKYVSPEKLQEYVDNADFDNAIKSFTLDDNGNLVIVTWSTNESGELKLKTNNSMNLKTALSKYMMPYEYLLYFYIDSDDENFVSDLADEVMNSEIVMAIQDNVTTTDTIDITEQRIDAQKDKYDTDWHQTAYKRTVTESVSTSVNLTYVSTWCVKAYQENSYSEAVLNLGNNEEKIVNIAGKVTESKNKSQTNDYKTNELMLRGEDHYSVEKDGKQELVTEEYYYNILEHLNTSTHMISNSYEKGEYKTEGRENVFVNLYIKYKMVSKVRTADFLFQIIENNERTANMLDLTKYLIYKATNQPWGVLEFDYEGEYSLQSFNSVSGSGGQIPLYKPVLSKENFIAAMQAYSYNSSFETNFKSNAELIYDTSVANGINPELVVVTAQTEQSYNAGGGANNYWGIAVYNGSSSGKSFASLADGIAGYASVVKSYETDSDKASQISERATERQASGCSSLGYGQPGTLSGMQSIYSFLGYHEYGSAGSGGYYYMDPARAGVTMIYSTHQEFLEKCYNAGGEHSAGSKTTIWEQGQYTAYQVQQKIDVWNDIFGAYGSLAGAGGEIIPDNGDGYFQTYTSSIGKTYREYKQWAGSYANMPFSYYPGDTIATGGCSITSVATVTSGYSNNQTPGTLADRTPNIAQLLSEGGAQCSGYESADAQRLTSGKPAVVSISGTLITERGSKYYAGHYIAVLDGRNGDEVYVSDVGANDSKCGGWTKVQDLINIVNRGVLYVTN